MGRSRKHEVGVGVLLLVALGLMAWVSVRIGALQGLGETMALTVVLQDAAGLNEGAEVKVAGVSVGRVRGLRIDHDTAVVEFEVRADAGLRADAAVQVRARSVLGEKYLDLSPQSRDAPLLQSGDRLTATRPQTEIDELVNALGPVIAAADPAQIDAIVAALHHSLAEDPDRLDRMVSDLEVILDRGAVAAEALPAAVSEGRAAVADLRGLAAHARPVLQRADVVVTRLDAATVNLPATAVQLDGLVVETRAAVAEARDVLGVLSGSTDDVERVLDNLSEIDKWELRRLLREEGILVRLRRSEVVAAD
jgi:phospholipid/cholesterol/gamma-HCH transport system substrate-binding protein